MGEGGAGVVSLYGELGLSIYVWGSRGCLSLYGGNEVVSLCMGELRLFLYVWGS